MTKLIYGDTPLEAKIGELRREYDSLSRPSLSDNDAEKVAAFYLRMDPALEIFLVELLADKSYSRPDYWDLPK